MTDLNTLQELGLSIPEIRVYKGLLELGQSQTGKLCTHTKVPSSKIYAILESLAKKGLVSHTIKNNTKIYSASSSESIKNLFSKKKEELDQKEEQINAIIHSLKKIKSHNEITPYKYFEGLAGIKSMYNEILQEMKKDKTHTLKIHSADVQMTNRLLGFYTDFHKKRVYLKVPYQLFLSKDAVVDIKQREKELTKIKKKNITSKIGWGIYNNYFFLNYNGGKEPYGILITDGLTAKTFELLFDELWNSN